MRLSSSQRPKKEEEEEKKGFLRQKRSKKVEEKEEEEADCVKYGARQIYGLLHAEMVALSCLPFPFLFFFSFSHPSDRKKKGGTLENCLGFFSRIRVYPGASTKRPLISPFFRGIWGCFPVFFIDILIPEVPGYSTIWELEKLYLVEKKGRREGRGKK